MNSKHTIDGFTVLELLLSMAVLAILVVLIGNLANLAAATTTTARRRLEMDNQARMVFDRMSSDFSGIIKRKDVDAIFLKQNGNDKMFFYSETPAYYASDPVASKRSPLALLGYRINSKFELERLGKGLTWDGDPYSSTGGSLNFLTYPNGNSNSSPLTSSTIPGRWKRTIGNAPNFSGVDRDYHTLSSQVCRLEICFQLKSTETATKVYSLNPYYPEHANQNGIQDVCAIIVTIALVDSLLLQDTSHLTHLIEVLPDLTTSDLYFNPPKLPAAVWKSQIGSPGIAQQAGIVDTTMARMQIYERCFYLHPR